MAQRDLRKVAAEAKKVAQAQEGLRRAILAALDSGEVPRDVSPYAGLSHSKINDMRKERDAANDAVASGG